MGNTCGHVRVCVCAGLGGALGGAQSSLECPLYHSLADFFKQEARPSAEGSEVPSPPPISESK